MSSIQASTVTPTKTSLHYKVITATANNVAAGSNGVSLAITGFDSNILSANSGNSFTLPPGVYHLNCNASFPMPVTGTGAMWCSLSMNTNTNGAAISPTTFQSSGFSGWAANNGTMLPLNNTIYAPTTITIIPNFVNQTGNTISNVTATIAISQIKAY